MINPRVISFDSDTRRIQDRAKVVGTYDEVTGVVVKTIKDSDGPDEYSLMVRLGENPKLRIEQGKNREEIFELADEVAEILKIGVEKAN